MDVGTGSATGWLHFSCPGSLNLRVSCEKWGISQLFRKVGKQAEDRESSRPVPRALPSPANSLSSTLGR